MRFHLSAIGLSTIAVLSAGAAAQGLGPPNPAAAQSHPAQISEPARPVEPVQISEYVREVFQDRDGDF